MLVFDIYEQEVMHGITAMTLKGKTCLTQSMVLMCIFLFVSFSTLFTCARLCVRGTGTTALIPVHVEKPTCSETLSININPTPFLENNRVKDEVVLKLLDHNVDGSYYDSKYWEYQRPMGEMGGILEQWKFREYIPPEASCVDFGAGGGFLLNNLQTCAQKLGIEINPHGIGNAKTFFNITLFNSIDLIEDHWADVIFSNHALEHALCPWCELRRLREKLKPGTGKLVFVVPAAGRTDEWTGSPDVNNHVYSWSPKTLGNLVSSAGYVDVKVDILAHQWPDNPLEVYQQEGEMGFIKKGQLKNQESPYGGCEYQLRVVARSSF